MTIFTPSHKNFPLKQMGFTILYYIAQHQMNSNIFYPAFLKINKIYGRVIF
jgi:hypothetical protein